MRTIFRDCRCIGRPLGLISAALAVGIILTDPLDGKVFVGATGALALGAQPKPAERPDANPEDEEERLERREMGRRAVQDNCLICHSEEMIASQRLTPPQWKTEVEKMVGWGSPLPADQVAFVIEYLAETYSGATPPVPPARITYEKARGQFVAERTAGAIDPAGVDRGSRLFATNCANCHGPDGQGAELGPNLVERLVLVRPLDFAAVVRGGRHRMPGFQAVLSGAQGNEILAWLRQQHYQSTAIKAFIDHR